MKKSAEPPDEPAWGKEWSIGLRLWVEQAGGRFSARAGFELLQGIERTHSISAAARQMGMSYRRAWELVQSINEAAGEPLVTAKTGGSHGGAARRSLPWASGRSLPSIACASRSSERQPQYFPRLFAGRIRRAFISSRRSRSRMSLADY